MPFMLKIQWDIKAEREADFRANQAAPCKVMLEHPGVICYHAYYPSQPVSQWTEIYATDEAFAGRLANRRSHGTLSGLHRQVCDLGLNDMLVIGILELDGIGMSARLENDVVFLCQPPVHVGR
jgi:hypothetical protein